MEEDSEVLDWGNEDDELAQHGKQQTGLVDGVEDAEEDAVSLGGDEDDTEHYYAYQSASNQDFLGSSLPAPKPSAVPPPPHQQQNSHGNREAQRDHPGSSSNTPVLQSQNSPQQPSKRRSQSQSQSLGKMTHSLPPKPVSSTVSFLQPAHPSSIIEATAMSLHRDKKSNGSISKPISPDDVGDSLPPDWEVKYPRSGGGAYYYNIKTHQSTWTRPVNGGKSPIKDKDRGRTQTSDSRPSIRSGNSSPSRPSDQLKPSHSGHSEEPQVPSTALSYDDRHYRPGEAAQIANVVEKRREERFDSNNKRSSTPPRSPRMSPGLPPRPPSPIGRGRDEKRSSRSHRKLSPQAVASDVGSLRDPQKLRVPPRVSSPDRHWIALEPLPRKSSGRRPASSDDDDHHHQRQHENIDMSPASPITNEDSSFRNNDAERSSTLRHRSPPPHMRDSRPIAAQAARTADASQPPQAVAPRAKSRFDQPASTSPRVLRAPAKQRNDVYIPPDPDRSDREHELTSTQIGGEPHEAKRRRTTSATNRRPAPELDPGPPSLTERSMSGSSSSQVQEQSRLKRAPLPPQSARFREASRRTPANSDPTPLPSLAAHAPPPPAPKDGGMILRATNVDNSLPSGPRNQTQVAPPSRDTNNHPDLRNNARLPPSGPSAGSTGRSRRNESSSFNANQQSTAPRDRNTMDVDPAPPARPPPPPLRVNEMPIRANSGMYADREQQRVEINISTDAAPRGPRAMTNRMSTSSAHPSFAPSPSTSPTTPLYSQRSAGAQERTGNRQLQRSPPPHSMGNNSFQMRDGPQAPFSASGMSSQNMLGRRASNASERGHGPYQEMESRDQSRREPLVSHPRHDQVPQAPPPAPRGFSGSNSIPIGTRKGQNNGQMAQPPHPGNNRRSGPQLSGGNGNVESLRNRSTRGVPPFDPPAPSADDSYAGPSGRMNVQQQKPFSGRMTPPHQHRPISPVDSFQTSAAPGRSRGADWYPGPTMSRAEVPAREASPPRTWTVRQQSQQYAEYDHENDFRDETPPQEPSWEIADRHRPPNSYPPDRAHHPAQFNGDSRHDTREPRQRHYPHVEVDRVDRVASHPTPSDRSSIGMDIRHPQQSEERYVDDSHRSRSALSPGTLRRQPSFTSHTSFGVDYADDREPFSEREVRSWDRDQELQRDHYSPVLTRGAPDRAPMFEGNTQSFSAADHEPSAPRLSKHRVRPGSHSVQNYPDDVPVRLDGQGEHWPLDGGRGVERTRDEPAPRSNSHHRRPTPSRRGGSLLDRLSLDNVAGSSSISSPSLRDRVQIVPSKRDREEMVGNDAAREIDMDEGGPEDSASKKPRRRMKIKRARRSGGQ